MAAKVARYSEHVLCLMPAFGSCQFCYNYLAKLPKRNPLFLAIVIYINIKRPFNHLSVESSISRADNPALHSHKNILVCKLESNPRSQEVLNS